MNQSEPNRIPRCLALLLLSSFALADVSDAPRFDLPSFGPLYDLLLDDEAYTCCTFSPDGRRLAAGTDGGRIFIFDTGTGKSCRELKQEADVIHDVVFSPSGRSLASIDVNGVLRCWPLDESGRSRSLKLKHGMAASVRWGPSNDCVAVLNSTSLILIDPESWKQTYAIDTLEAALDILHFSPDGSFLVICSDKGLVRLSLRDHTQTIISERNFSSATFSGERLLAARDDGAVVSFDLKDRSEKVGTRLYDPSLDAVDFVALNRQTGILIFGARLEIGTIGNSKPFETRYSVGGAVTRLAWGQNRYVATIGDMGILTVWGRSLAGARESRRPSGYLGIEFELRNDGSGILVKRVIPGTAAEKAGLEPGDVISHVESRRLAAYDDVFRSIRMRREGDAVELSVIRGEKRLGIGVKLGARPNESD
jgi:WD40 repeat protein